MRACAKLAQQHEHDINGKKVEAKAAIPKDQGGSRLTKKLYVGLLWGPVLFSWLALVGAAKAPCVQQALSHVW